MGSIVKVKRKNAVPTTKRTGIGRPSKYNEKLAKALLEEISKGKTLQVVCKSLGICITSVYDWIRVNTSFAESYQLARAEMAQSLVDEMVDEAKVLEPDRALVTKVKAQIYQWTAAKYAPSIFSDNRRVEIRGEVSHKHTHELQAEQKRRIAEAWILSSGQEETVVIPDQTGVSSLLTVGVPKQEKGVTTIQPVEERLIPGRVDPDIGARRKPGRPKGKARNALGE